MKISLNWLKEYIDVSGYSIELLDKIISLNIIEIDALEKLVEANNLVVGFVEEKTKHPDADKLNICKVNIGSSVEQIVCGAKNVDNSQHVIVALPGAVLPGDFKIKPAKVRGVESNGMICSLSELGIDQKFQSDADKEGIFVFKDEVKAGDNPLVALCFDDTMIELGLTPNRTDLMSHYGFAKDLSTMTGKKVNNIEMAVAETNTNNDVTVNVNTKDCLSYFARKVDVEIAESPQFIKSRLITCGIRPINNVVDITNYVMLELGQPLHAFDASLVENNTINIENAKKGTKVTTLDSEERTLESTDIVVCDGSKPIAIAGVMGLANSEVSSSTKTIILESALFNSSSVRKTSSRLNLRSESSSRFERGIDKTLAKTAIDRAAYLLTKYASGKVYSGVIGVDNTNYSPTIVEITLDKINNYLGTNISSKEMNDIFTKLFYEVEVKNDNFKLTIPSNRIDVSNYQDIVEEVARVYGFNNIPSTLPKCNFKGGKSEFNLFRDKLSSYFVGHNFDETVNYSLLNENEVFKYTTDSSKAISLALPMSEERTTLRKSLLNGLLESASYNKARKINNLKLFELGKKYAEQNEDYLISGLILDNYIDEHFSNVVVKSDFYVLKGLIDGLFSEIGIEAEYEMFSDLDTFHPGRSASIKIGGCVVGLIGCLHPKVSNELDLPDTYVFELNVNELFKLSNLTINYEIVPKFPGISRDFSFIAKNEVTAREIITCIKKYGKKLLNNVSVKDVYSGDKMEEGRKSITMTLFFLDPKNTLETNIVDERCNKILKKLDEELNVYIRN